MKPDFNKYPDALVPAIVQDATDKKVLMLGYMNEASWQQTIDTKLVTFYSRSRNGIWVKGATSGNYLHLVDMVTDCDNDCLLVKATADGATCHTGAATCFGGQDATDFTLHTLEQTIIDRKENPSDKSYTATLFSEGIPRIAQKVGEEAVELVIEAMQQKDDKFIGEAADLLYHFLVLLQAKNMSLNIITKELERRAGKSH